ncbi:alpha/beta fold hydrolase [Corynebacterium uropygiale]|uniref:Alpha/beta fold hydrolase n=1 Tax=Corynebacterium uropygiale TaxID=1775911 RepID=A0A9X1QRC0_9CORY|nr:alpha/beta fold hydrolase [Corynebacterium uropygiale]MCF4007721.1 alpha/beta fold hydrolase [Corynebacterium uropygiale]
MRRSRVMHGLAALLTSCALGCALAPTAAAADIAPWTGMGAQLPPKDNLNAAKLAGGHAQDPSPTGVNEECTPAPGENPVILIHGMASNAYEAWAGLGPLLKSQGKCVYALNYGAYPGADGQGSSAMGAIPGTYGVAPLAKNVEEVSAQIDSIREHTGAEKVDLVGWSQGGTIATAYTKARGGKGVGTVVTLAGVLRGTSMMGLANLHREMQLAGAPIDPVVTGILGPVGNDLLEMSPFMTQLRDGGLEVDGVRYVSISTLFDTAATPLNNTQFSSGDYQNIVLQDGCPNDLADHQGMPYDPRAMAYTVNALGGNVPVQCTGTVGPFIPGSSM